VDFPFSVRTDHIRPSAVKRITQFYLATAIYWISEHNFKARILYRISFATNLVKDQESKKGTANYSIFILSLQNVAYFFIYRSDQAAHGIPHPNVSIEIQEK
jgi:hypothetical protein